jgi:hypothetical protein
MELDDLYEINSVVLHQPFAEDLSALRKVREAFLEAFFVSNCLEQLQAAFEVVFLEKLKVYREFQWVAHLQLWSL